MNRYRLAHVTEFKYDGVVSDSYNVVRLRPRDDDVQSCISFKLVTAPASRAASYVDTWGNWVHTFNVLGEGPAPVSATLLPNGGGGYVTGAENVSVLSSA